MKSDDDSDAVATDLALAIQMRALAGFYAGAVHDLKAPLNAMVITLELLADALRSEDDVDAEVGARRQRHLEVLRKEIARLNDSVQSLLAQTPPVTEATRVFDLRGLLEEIRALFASQTARRRVTLEIQTGRPLAVVGARNRMKQALLTIVMSALETVTEGGVEVAGTVVGKRIVLSFRYDGSAVDGMQRERLYRAHVMTPDGRAVTGLCVARDIVEAHGGQIGLEIESNRETRVRVTLPLAVSEEGSVPC